MMNSLAQHKLTKAIRNEKGDADKSISYNIQRGSAVSEKFKIITLKLRE